MDEKKGYKKLFVWQKADLLAYEVYQVTKFFPKSELFGIISQLRRAALSVPTNLVEGQGRQNRKELRHFVNISLGSISEVEYLLDFSNKLHYLNQEECKRIQKLRREVGSLLWRLFQSLS